MDPAKAIQAIEAKCNLADALNLKGALLKDAGDLENALKAFQESEAIAREVNAEFRVMPMGSSDWEKAKSVFDAKIAQAKGNQAPVLFEQGKFEEAFACLHEAQRIAKKANDFDLFGLYLRNEGILLERRGHLEESLVPLREAETVFRQLGDSKGLAETLLVQINIVDFWESEKDAERIAEEALNIAEINGLPELAGRIRRRIESLQQNRTVAFEAFDEGIFLGDEDGESSD